MAVGVLMQELLSWSATTMLVLLQQVLLLLLEAP